MGTKKIIPEMLSLSEVGMGRVLALCDRQIITNLMVFLNIVVDKIFAILSLYTWDQKAVSSYSGVEISGALPKNDVSELCSETLLSSLGLR